MLGEVVRALREAAALIASQAEKIADLEADYLRRHNDAVDRFEKLTAAEARIAALEGALKPFADLCEKLDFKSAADSSYIGGGVTYGHLRAARAALEATLAANQA